MQICFLSESTSIFEANTLYI